jgi:hopanoid biosynthesis associated protein HpnK
LQAPANALKSLILTGDDFGRSSRVNEAIIFQHEAGLLTQASLMVNEPHAEEAARLAHEHPRLCVGLHLTLCSGRAAKCSGLTNTRGEFEVSPTKAGLRYFFRRSLESDLAAEITRQFEKFRTLGFAPSYWDGHTHLHLHPRILRLSVPIAYAHGFRFVRLVREPSPRGALGHIFAGLSRAAVRRLQSDAIAFCDHVCGLHESGRMTTAAFLRILEKLPDGLTEIYSHPGADPEALDPQSVHPSLARHRIRLTHALNQLRIAD